MDNNDSSKTLAVVGLVVGITALIISLIECVGTIAFLPGIIGAILGVIAYLKAKDSGHPKGLSTVTIVVSLLACAISVYQIYAFQNMNSDMKQYADCVELEADYKKLQNDLKDLIEEVEETSSALSNISKITSIGFELENIQEQAEVLGCDLIEDMYSEEEESEGEVEKVDNTEGEGESKGE